MKILKRNKYRILKNILRYSFVIVFGFSLILVSSVSVNAACGDLGEEPCAGSDNTGTQPIAGSDNTNNNLTGGNSINIQTGINNPLGDGNLETIPDFIEKIIDIVLVVGIPIVTLAIIYSGFLFVKASGDPEGLKKAKSALFTSLIGAVLLLGAFVLANAIKGTVDEIKRTALLY